MRHCNSTKSFLQNKRTYAKNEKYFFCTKFFCLPLKYECRKGLYQVNFWTETEAGSHQQEFIVIWIGQNH